MWPSIGIDGRLVDPSLPQQADDRLDKPLCVRRVDQHADPFVGNGIAATTTRATHDFQPAGGRFEIDDAEAFLAARHHIEVGKAIEIGKILLRHETQKANGGGISGNFQRALLEARAVVATARHDMNQIGKPRPECGQGRKNLLVSFVALAGGQAADGQQHWTGAEREAIDQRFGRRPGREDFPHSVRKHAHLRILQMCPRHEDVPGAAADGGHHVGGLDRTTHGVAPADPGLRAMRLHPEAAAGQACHDPGERRHVDVAAEHHVDRPVTPRRQQRRQQVRQPAEDRRQLADARRQRHAARVAQSRQNENFGSALGQGFEEVLVVACDAAGAPVAIADKSEDARAHLLRPQTGRSSRPSTRAVTRHAMPSRTNHRRRHPPRHSANGRPA